MAKKVNARQVGHAYERQLRLEFVELGFSDCQTSRYASKMTDDLKVDFVGLPWNVQAKRWASAPSYHKTLSEMPNDKPRMIFHKRPHQGEVVVMFKEDFYNLIKP